MPRPPTPKVLTANDLLGGHPVWRDQRGDWTADARRAQVYDDPAEADLALLDAEAQAHIVVGAYLTEARAASNGPAPVHYRERIRVNGPSIPVPAAAMPQRGISSTRID